MIGEFDSRLERREVRVWSLEPLKGFCCKSFFLYLLDQSLLSKFVFDKSWRIKIPKRVKLYFWQVLMRHLNSLDLLLRKLPLLVDPF